MALIEAVAAVLSILYDYLANILLETYTCTDDQLLPNVNGYF